MNPSDLIRILKLLLGVKFEVTSLLHHFRVMLRAYYQALAKDDFILAKEVNLQVDKPVIYRDGLSSILMVKFFKNLLIFKDEQKNNKTVNVIMLMDDKEKFPNDFIIKLIRRMNLNERTNDKEIKEVEKILSWMLAVRKVILEAINMI